MIEIRKLHRMSTLAATIDVRKAYDRIDRTLLCEKLNGIGIYGSIYNDNISLRKSVEYCVCINGQLTELFNVQCRLKQWCISSPLLFNLYISNLSTYICSQNVGVEVDCEKIFTLLYADDLVVLAESEKDLLFPIDGLNIWCSGNELQLVKTNRT